MTTRSSWRCYHILMDWMIFFFYLHAQDVSTFFTAVNELLQSISVSGLTVRLL